MTFQPKHWHDGHQTRTAFVVRELVKNVELLVLDSMCRFKVVKISKDEAASLKPVDFGSRGERKMRASLRRIAKKKGTTKKARLAVKQVLS